jgi:hypothetical protein
MQSNLYKMSLPVGSCKTIGNKKGMLTEVSPKIGIQL